MTQVQIATSENAQTTLNSLPTSRSVSLDHAAQLLSVSRRTIYNRIKDGQLVTVRAGGSQRVLVESLQTFARLSLVLLAVAILGLGSTEAAAQGRRARLSEDLKQKVAAGDARQTSVILTASSSVVDQVAARHGLRISKRLATGAVLEVPAGALQGLVDDAAIDQLSGNSVVQSSMAITNEAIGETLLRSGQL